jgi:hypothetical protein
MDNRKHAKNVVIKKYVKTIVTNYSSWRFEIIKPFTHGEMKDLAIPPIIMLKKYQF